MQNAKQIDWLFLDVGGVLLTNGWGRGSRSTIELVPTADIPAGSRLVASFQESDAAIQAGEDAANEVSLDDQAPVVQLVARIVGQALRDRASDIHIEPLDRDVPA